MKRFLMILLMLSSLAAKCQLGWEDFYSEKDFRAMLHQAKNPKEKMYALGLLTRKGLSLDSIIREINLITARTNDKSLKASALWWESKLHEDDTTRMLQLFQFSEQNQLETFKIAAYFLLADYYIHHSQRRSLYYAMRADSLLEKMHERTKETDSLKIEALRCIAHAYIHRRDGVNAARYILPLRNYAERNNDEHTRTHAMEVLADMYSEGDYKRSIPWIKMLRDYFKKTGEAHKYTGMTWNLAGIYSALYETGVAEIAPGIHISDSIADLKVQAIKYFKELDRLIDSLGAYGSYLYWLLRAKFKIELLSGEEVIGLVDNSYNSHYHFTPIESRNLKLDIYLTTGQFDSLEVYISKIPESEFKSIWLKDYYLKKRDFDKAIPILKKFLEDAESRHSIGTLQWVYPDLVKAYVGLKDYKPAYEYKLKSLQIKDTLDKLEGKEEIASLEMQKQIELQQAAFDDEQAKTAFRNKMRLYGFIAGLAAFLVVALILLRSNRRKQKDKLKIEQAYNELKSTQQQLIQSEKMASLGELTAGIAHEIQNPLNFVNNFSEINKELADELEREIDKGNHADARTIAKEIRENEEKINHHGKRADAIVKNMLQHSRSSSGKKETTDINALAGEYLRLAYHGFRAKDKSFNADIQTNFDSSIDSVNIIPQDIGRVLLNLINNAFYAVSEKQNHNLNGYVPTVSVTTKRINGKVEIKVADNGNGISQKILDKIFQPFFTTKPTGQGTGLGLSLAYDIITKGHGGDIKVNTKENEGSEFIILLPAQT